jgi:hypothetical protein
MAEQALEGAYFAQELFAAAKQGRIGGGFPYDPRSTVHLPGRRLRSHIVRCSRNETGTEDV